MGQGLGRNSPVQLSLGRENYEALIERHGQWIRWRIANKCACVNRQTFQPDLHCKLCGGRGVTYTYQPKQIVQTIVMAKDNGNILELDKDFENDSLIKVYDFKGNLINSEKQECFIITENQLSKGVYYNIVLERDNVNKIENITLEKSDGGYWLVPGLENKRSNIDGIYYSSPSDIIKTGKITDAEGEEFEVEELRLNKILLKQKVLEVEEENIDGEIELNTVIVEPVEPLCVEYVNYIKPYIFALLNQNLSKTDVAAVAESNGDAICTYPYSCDVANDDVLTVLAGTITNKDIIAKTKGKIDKLPAYFVESITSIIGKDGTEYVQGEDFVLVGTNEIKWLDDEYAPEVGEGYSVTYKVYPTYVVLRDIPQLRSSENQRFPKKAVVKYMVNYSEQKKVNRQ